MVRAILSSLLKRFTLDNRAKSGAGNLLEALFWIIATIILIASIPVILLFTFALFVKVIQALTWLAKNF